jgi:hypothetical protein
MAKGDLTLVYTGVTVIFNRFLDNTPPRENANLSGKASFSINGNFVVTGINFESPQRYTIKAKVSIADSQKLRMMWAVADKARRDLGSPYMVLNDWITEYAEAGKTTATKTRTAVSGTTPREEYGGVAYFPVLQVFMSSEPTFGIDTGVGYVNCVIELQETGVKI